MADHVDHGIDVVVGECRGLFGGIELGGQREGAGIPAHGVHHHVHGVALAGAGVADVDTLAGEVADMLDAGVGTCHHGQRLGCMVKTARISSHGTVGLEVGHAMVGTELDVGLHHAHVELAGLHAVDVGHGAAGGGGVTAYVVLVAAAVHHAADGLADDIVDAGLAAGTDGDEIDPGPRRARRTWQRPAELPRRRLRKKHGVSLTHLLTLLAS
jgi:hypothetical protein